MLLIVPPPPPSPPYDNVLLFPTFRTSVLTSVKKQPNIMYNHDHPAYRKLQELGREITTKVKPRAIVVFSAHWQGGRDYVQVNTAESTDLIYEYVRWEPSLPSTL